MVIIGITGTLCSGKGMLTAYFKERGFDTISLSDLLREEANLKGIELTRENLQRLGNELREKHGSGALAILALQRILGKENMVIESIRNPGEVLELRKNKDFKLIAVDAPRELRIERLLNRYNESERKEDPVTRETVIEKMDIDEGKNQLASGQQSLETMKLADFHIYNDKDSNYLISEASRILNLIT